MNKPFKRSAEDIALAARRAAARDIKKRAELTRPAYTLLTTGANCGIIALKGAKIDFFLDGLDEIFKLAEDQPDEKRVLRIDAFGSIQGEDMGDIHGQEVLLRASQHRRKFGKHAVIAFLGYDFSDDNTTGTKAVTERFKSVITTQNSVSRSQDTEPSILLIGDGRQSFLPAHPNYDVRQAMRHPIGGLVLPRLALTSENKLAYEVNFRSEDVGLAQTDPLYRREDLVIPRRPNGTSPPM